MKKHLSLLSISVLLLGTLSPTLTFGADFFQDQVIKTSNKNNIRDQLRDIQIKDVTLRSNTERLRLAQAQFFLSQTKKELTDRYSNGDITKYDLEDIQNELTYLAHSLNQYFANIRSFERTKNSDYQKLASQNLDDANQSYTRLKSTTLKAVRNG